MIARQPDAGGRCQCGRLNRVSQRQRREVSASLSLRWAYRGRCCTRHSRHQRERPRTRNSNLHDRSGNCRSRQANHSHSLDKPSPWQRRQQRDIRLHVKGRRQWWNHSGACGRCGGRGNCYRLFGGYLERSFLPLVSMSKSLKMTAPALRGAGAAS